MAKFPESDYEMSQIQKKDKKMYKLARNFAISIYLHICWRY